MSAVRKDEVVDRAGYETKRHQDLQIPSSIYNTVHFGLDALGIRCISINSSKWSPTDPGRIGVYQGLNVLGHPRLLRIITDVMLALSMICVY